MSSHQRARRPSGDNKQLPNLPEPATIPRKALARERSNQEQSVKSLHEQLKEEQNKLDELSEEYVTVYNELQRAIKALGSIHSSDKFFQDDKQITKLVEELRYDIKQWSHQNFPTRTSLRKNNITSYLSQPENVFKSVVNDPKFYLSSDQGGDLPALIQSYIWNELTDTVFDNGLWVAGPVCCRRSSETKKPCRLFEYWNGLNKIMLEGEMHDPEPYHQWRCQTARLVSPRAHQECLDEGIRIWVKDRRKELKFLGPAENRHIFYAKKDGESGSLDISLETITRSAVRLDQILWQQKASFRFALCDDQYQPKEFDPTIMESGLEDEATGAPGGFDNARLPSSLAVKLVKAPYFEKCGTSEGTGYDTWDVLLKSSVELVQSSIPPKVGLSSRVLSANTASIKRAKNQDRTAAALSPPDRST